MLDIPAGPPPPTESQALPPGRLDIDVRDVTFSYRSRADRDLSDDTVLRHINIHIPAGQQVAMVGATGSGKTTLGRLIARFADPTVGEIFLGGVPLTAVDNDELRHRLVVVAQEPFLFDDTIAANVRFARPGADDAAILAVVARLDVVDWLDAMPDGLNTRVGQRGEQLSAGERQLVALLRAGLADPDVLLLDEATSSVDALTEVRMSRALSHLAEGRTTIAIAHRLSTAARADRVLVLARRPARRGRPPRRADPRRRHVQPAVRRLDLVDRHHRLIGDRSSPSDLDVRAAGEVAARQHLQVGVAEVVVADEREAVGADGDRRVGPDVADGVDGGGRDLGARGSGAARHLEVVVGVVAVADEREAVGADGDRRVAPNLTDIVDGVGGDGGTFAGGAAGHLQIVVGVIQVADDGDAVGADGDRRELDLTACRRRWR